MSEERKAWYLSLPYICNDSDGKMHSLNPHQWEGTNGWNTTNAQSFVICSHDEKRAREYAAEMDCGIWLDSRYAACVPFANCYPDWKEGVTCVEWGESESE